MPRSIVAAADGGDGAQRGGIIAGRRRDLEEQFLLLAAGMQLKGPGCGLAQSIRRAPPVSIRRQLRPGWPPPKRECCARPGAGNMRTLSVMLTATGGTTVRARVSSPWTRST